MWNQGMGLGMIYGMYNKGMGLGMMEGMCYFYILTCNT